MGKAKKPQKFAVVKKMISHKALKHYKEEVLNPNKKDLTELPRNVPSVPAGLFFSYNSTLVPPYRVLVDTNFINFSIQNKVGSSSIAFLYHRAIIRMCIDLCRVYSLGEPDWNLSLFEILFDLFCSGVSNRSILRRE
jgi:hypothetical protein